MSTKVATIREIPLNLQDWADNEAYVTDGKALIQAASKGLIFYEPHLIESGDGGAYLLRSETNQLLAIFKPFDEDPFSDRNPKSEENKTWKHSTHQRGMSAHREVAAYLLDHQRKAGVPLTLLVRLKCSRWGSEGKIGSLQKYEKHDHDSWELGPSLYDVDEVQRIALLDMRIINSDRHGGNILVRKENCSDNKKSSLKLIPIDHGLCLPDQMLQGKDLWFEWMSWPQAKKPIDLNLQKYIFHIDLEKDANLLRDLGLNEDIVENMLLCSAIVQQGVMKGFTPYRIAKIITKLPPKGSNWHGGRIRLLLNEIKGIRQRIEKPLIYSMVPTLGYRRHCSVPHIPIVAIIGKATGLNSMKVE